MARARTVLIVVVLIALGAIMTTNLETMPGLHGDEAWFGLRALDIAAHRDSSIHGMTPYSGALFPWLVSLAFRVRESIAAMRMIGVAANLSAFALAGLLSWKLGGTRRALVTLLLFAGSFMLTAETRVAWEVTALAPLLAIILIFTTATWPARPSRREATLRSFVLISVSSLGVYNHVIFLTVVGGLFVASVLTSTPTPNPTPTPPPPPPTPPTPTSTSTSTATSTATSTSTATATATSLLLVLAKIALFKSGSPSSLLLFLSPPLFLAEAILIGRINTVSPFFSNKARLIRRGAWIFFCTLGLAFLILHGGGFFRVLANDVLTRRLFSETMPAPLLALSYAWAALALGAYAHVLIRVVRGRITLPPPDRLLLLLPVTTCALLPALIGAEHIRHYMLPVLVTLLGASTALEHVTVERPRLARAVVPAALAYALSANAFLARVVADPNHYASRTPTQFRIALDVETSAHFFPTRDLAARANADGVENVRTRDPVFIALPVELHRRLDPRAPSEPRIPGQTAIIDYDYTRTGGLSYVVEK